MADKKELEKIYSITELLHYDLSIDELLKRLASIIAREFGFDAVLISVRTKSGNPAPKQAVVGVLTPFSSSHSTGRKEEFSASSRSMARKTATCRTGNL